MYIDKPLGIMYDDYVILCLTRKSEKVIKIILETNFPTHVSMYIILGLCIWSWRCTNLYHTALLKSRG